jgi:chromosome partitioning protein
MRTSIVPSCGARLLPHVVVIGNQKGGSGKSTFAMHIIVALLKAGKRVASFDLDLSQLTLTRYIGNRREWARENELALELPDHCMLTEESPLGKASSRRVDQRPFISKSKKTGRAQKCSFIDDVTPSHSADLRHFISHLKRIEQEHQHDFIVIDTPGGLQHLSLIAHGMADTLITPINDSLLDLDVLVSIKRSDRQPRPSTYANAVRRALDARRNVSGRPTDWIVVRNRLELFQSGNHRQISLILDAIRSKVGFRVAHGLLERPVYREFFASGLTVFDAVGAAKASSTRSFLARIEVRNLVRELRLIDDQEALEEGEIYRDELEMAGGDKIIS